MSDTSTAAIAAATAPTPASATFTLDEPVMLGTNVLIEAGVVVTVRKPGSGELRGLQLVALNQLDVFSLETLAPRITSPVIVKGATMSPSDLMQFGAEVMDFLLPTAAKAQLKAAYPTA
jgi:hypothetical protein